jgi:O-antigen/teichoic acid export membrane protein
VILARNFLAGLTNSIWSMVVTLVCVPLYLYYLGVEAYGLVGFFVFSQSVLQLLDLGLAPTINREVARCRSQGNMRDAAELLRTFAIIYWAVGALILVCFFLAAPYIASYWLNADGLSVEEVSTAAVLIGFVIACRWPLGLYQGALIGAERVTVTSAINMIMTSTASIGAVAVLAFISPTIQAFFLWQAAVGLVYSVTMSRAAWNIIGRDGRKGFSRRKLREVWRFSAGMSLVAVSAIVLMQVDKAILSRLLSLEAFGQYMLAVLISSSLYVLLRPLFNVIYPRMSALVIDGRTDELIEFYTLGTRVLCATLFPIAAAIATFSLELVQLWTQDSQIALEVAPLVSLLLIGTALNGAMHFPYALQLASGSTRIPLAISTILIAFSIPMTILLTLNYGAIGGAASWAVLNCLYVLLGTGLTHRTLLRNQGMKWLTRDLLWPLAVSVLIVVGGGVLFQAAGYDYFINLVVAVLLAVSAFFINLMLTREVVPRLRQALA